MSAKYGQWCACDVASSRANGEPLARKASRSGYWLYGLPYNCPLTLDELCCGVAVAQTVHTCVSLHTGAAQASAPMEQARFTRTSFPEVARRQDVTRALHFAAYNACRTLTKHIRRSRLLSDLRFGNNQVLEAHSTPARARQQGSLLHNQSLNQSSTSTPLNAKCSDGAAIIYSNGSKRGTVE